METTEQQRADYLFETAIRDSVEVLVTLPDEEWRFMNANRRLVTLEKGHHLLRIGDPVDSLFFVHKGLMRVYYENDGCEHNRSFTFDNRFYTNSYSYLTKTPSHYAVEALEPTVLSAWSREFIELSYERHPCWERFGRRSAEEDFIAKELKETESRIHSPAERYQMLVEQNSPMLERIPLYHLASFLGVTPETLSRIRKRQA